MGNFYQSDRGYLGLSYLLGGVFVTSLTAGIANLRFPDSFFAGDPPTVQQEAFSEQRVDASVFAEYRLSNTFGVNATVNYDRNITGVRVRTDPMDTVGDALAYQRWQRSSACAGFCKPTSMMRVTYRWMHWFIRGWSCLLVAFAAACAASHATHRSNLAAPTERYVLGPGDTFTLEIVGEKDLPHEYQVASDGNRGFPLRAHAQGRGSRGAAGRALGAGALDRRKGAVRSERGRAGQRVRQSARDAPRSDLQTGQLPVASGHVP